MIQTRRRLAPALVLLLAALATGCGGEVVLPGDGEAAELEIVDGDEQLAPAGTVLGDPIIVAVTDTRGRPVTSQDVSFSVESGGGVVQPAAIKTDESGRAQANWTLGPSTGSQMLRVQTPRGGSGTLEVTFTATAVAGSGSNLAGAGGNEQEGPVNSALADPLVVRATDALGNPVANIEVTWSVSGGGSIEPATVLTDNDGLAAAERILGPTAGPQSAQAAVEGFSGSPVTFTHTAVPANPTALILVSGDDQTAPGGFEVAQDLVVRLEDDNGNGIGGRQVTWVVPSGSGSVTPVNSQTDANGLATTRWKLPSPVGSYTINAVFSGLPPVAFSATATADAPTRIALVSGNNQSAPVGTPVPNLLVVRVTDENNNPVANVSVAWTAVGGGSVSQNNTATDASGLAQVVRTLGLTPGGYTTRAEVDGLQGSPVTFNSTATVGPPAQLALVQSPDNPTTSGEAFAPAPIIQVQDAEGNPVNQGGIEVTATITSGQSGATLTNAERNTNGSGRATFNQLRITGPPDDDYVLTFTASVGGGPLTPASISDLVVEAGGANRIEIVTQPSGTAQNSVPFSQQPVVRVVDGTGNPVAGNWTVTAAIQSGPGALGGTVSASSGGTAVISFTDLRITGVTGNRTLRFTSGVLAGAVSNSINVVAGPASSIAIQAGNNQNAPAGTAVGTDPAVIVRDVSNNPVSGAAVEFDVTGGGGTVAPGTVTTGSNGIAAVDNWTLGTTPGANQLSATLASVGSVTFNATGTSTNSPPTAQADGYSVNEDQILTADATTGVLNNDDDPDNDPLTAQLVDGPDNSQSFTLNADGSFSYTPDPDFNGSDSFTYRANDGEANSNTVTVTITVNPIDDPPGFQAGSDITTSALGEILTNGFTQANWATNIDPGPPDESGQTVSFQVTTDNDGAFQQLPQVDPSGTLTFRSQATALAVVVNVTVVAEDSGGATSGPQSFTITINP